MNILTNTYVAQHETGQLSIRPLASYVPKRDILPYLW